MNRFACDVEEYQGHCDEYDGICVQCGEWSCGGVEPDAEKYECESCGAKAVMGAENALLFGILDIED